MPPSSRHPQGSRALWVFVHKPYVVRLKVGTSMCFFRAIIKKVGKIFGKNEKR